MASLYKKPIRITDPETGRRIRAKSRKWWGRYRDALGVECRVPLATDRTAAQAMLNQIVRKAELEASGCRNAFDDHAKTALAEHIEAFECFLHGKDNTEKHVRDSATKLRLIAEANKWTRIADISASDVHRYLANLRKRGSSIQTSNHYLRAIKSFSRWLVSDRRTSEDRLLHLSMLNARVDRRHDRRALGPEEFARLVEAAHGGPAVESISGPDRAVMYVLAAWTGYRRNEIGSLTRRSLRLDDDPPTATVAAGYSKRRRQDTQVLHPEVVRRLREWLATKGEIEWNEPLFPVSGKVPGGVERKTSKMMQRDLTAARAVWLEEATSAQERKRREQSDFLMYKDHDGRYADFHSNRHTFITNLERAGVSPRVAQTLARHSDIRLTMGIYTHIGLHDQTVAIISLPPPPNGDRGTNDGVAAPRKTNTA